jgi:uncharacterized protein
MVPESKEESKELENGQPALTPDPIASPITSTERILDLDILRGMALFGILAANMRGFSAPIEVYFNVGRWFHLAPDQWTQVFIDTFIQRKFVTLFSFMFGMGFAVQLMRAQAKGARFLSFYPRRLAALALFGLIHGIVIWSGDILLTYSITGTMLLFFRNRSQKTVLRWVCSILGVPLLAMTGFALATAFRLRKPDVDNFDPAKITGIIHVYASGSLQAILKQNWIEWVHELQSQAFSIFALSLFLFGLWVVRSGILEHLDDYTPVFKRICKVCLPLGIVLNFAEALIPVYYVHFPRPVFIGWADNILTVYSGPILSMGYATGLAVLLRDAAWRRRLMPFAAVGRTALTNYLSQSLICVTFFRLTHLYGVWGPAWDLLPTVVLFGIQILISNWWLQNYRFGPMEWVWRGLTYGTFPVLRRAAASPGGEPALGGLV